MKPGGGAKLGNSRNSGSVRNHYTDDKALYDDKIFHDSFEKHFEKWKIGQPTDISTYLDKVMKKVDSRKSSFAGKFTNFKAMAAFK